LGGFCDLDAIDQRNKNKPSVFFGKLVFGREAREAREAVAESSSVTML
jgi:hypothetical protein